MKAHGSKIEVRDPRSLTPSPHNSRSHPAEQKAAIWESIQRFGITRPVLILADGEIVAGHGVVETAIEHDLSSVPCRVLVGMTREEARAYIVADNRLAEMSSWDKDALSREVRELAAAGVDLHFLELGALDGDIAALLDEESETPEDEADRKAGSAPDGGAVGESKSINFPVYVILDVQQHKAWRALKGGMSDADFVRLLCRNAEALEAFLSQVADA